MKAASRYRPPRALRVLVVDAAASAMHVASAEDFAGLFDRGDVLVVNDAATLPASLQAGAVEIRLLGADTDGTWTAALLGAGDWHTRTEDRPVPPRVLAGQALRVADDLVARIVRVHDASPRLVTIRFESADLWSALYRHGRPVQYAHVAEAYALWDVQNVYAGRPWAVEMPSAGRVLTFETLAALDARGVRVLALTHAAGLSSVGDPAIDRLLPMPERYEIPHATWRAIAAASGRVVAVGTSVVRALESAARTGTLAGVTSLRIGPALDRAIVDGIVTGLHDAGSSHFELLGSFADRAVLDASLAEAESAELLAHEMGDACLLWARSPALRRVPSLGGARRSARPMFTAHKLSARC